MFLGYEEENWENLDEIVAKKCSNIKKFTVLVEGKLKKLIKILKIEINYEFLIFNSAVKSSLLIFTGHTPSFK